jgi:hypothetical protein
VVLCKLPLEINIAIELSALYGDVAMHMQQELATNRVCTCHD